MSHIFLSYSHSDGDFALLLKTELEKAGVDASGELGEYHTVVTAGPMFSSDISLEAKGQVRYEGYWFLETESKHGIG